MTCWFLHIPVIVSLIVSSGAYAHQIVKLSDMQTMAKRSDVVIHGYVGEKNVVTDDLGRLITLTQIEVIDGIYGAKTTDVITVYQVGGEQNGRVMPLMGGHTYELGQEVIFFGLALDDTFVSYGAGLGKFDIVKENGLDAVREDLGDISALNNDPKSPERIIRPSPLTYSSNAVLKDEIRLMVKAR